MKVLKMILRISVGTMILTLIHHGYGAIIYEASFRLHVAIFALPVIIILLLTYRVYQRRPASLAGKVAFRVFIVVTVVVPVGVIGWYEGGYNHLLKNLLFFGGASQATLDQLFPPPTYEMPNDFWFEATGILQFITAAYGLYYLSRLSATKRIERPKAVRG